MFLLLLRINGSRIIQQIQPIKIINCLICFKDTKTYDIYLKKNAGKKKDKILAVSLSIQTFVQSNLIKLIDDIQKTDSSR